MSDKESDSNKKIQIYFPNDKISLFDYCFAIMRKIQSDEVGKGNKCMLADALYILCKKYNNEVIE